MSARWLAFVIWAAVAACAVFWGFRLFVPAAPAPAHATAVSAAAAVRGDLARLLGSDARASTASAEAAPVADTRYQLVGVVSPKAQGAAEQGLALIAIDGKPAKAFRVGAPVEGDNVLQSVSARGADLGPKGGGAAISLAIPPPQAAATGTMPAFGAAPAAPAPVMQAAPFVVPRPPGASPVRPLNTVPRMMAPGGDVPPPPEGERPPQ